mmetsp:Transcript_10048/g.15309  ORF Transcript_10048/g.15309 Transcript_10048/m.15309 type:complete len:215 (-) Transcript_10048:6805-7449(-)
MVCLRFNCLRSRLFGVSLKPKLCRLLPSYTRLAISRSSPSWPIDGLNILAISKGLTFFSKWPLLFCEMRARELREWGIGKFSISLFRPSYYSAASLKISNLESRFELMRMFDIFVFGFSKRSLESSSFEASGFFLPVPVWLLEGCLLVVKVSVLRVPDRSVPKSSFDLILISSSDSCFLTGEFLYGWTSCFFSSLSLPCEYASSRLRRISSFAI